MSNPQSFSEGLEAAGDIDDRIAEIGAQAPAAIITDVILWLLGLSAVLAVAAIIWGAFLYIVSLGDENRASTGKQIILYAIIGLILAGGSFFIIQTIRDILI